MVNWWAVYMLPQSARVKSWRYQGWLLDGVYTCDAIQGWKSTDVSITAHCYTTRCQSGTCVFVFVTLWPYLFYLMLYKHWPSSNWVNKYVSAFPLANTLTSGQLDRLIQNTHRGDRGWLWHFWHSSLYLAGLLSQCTQNLIESSYMCLLLNGVPVISATQTENAWYSPKHKEWNVTIHPIVWVSVTLWNKDYDKKNLMILKANVLQLNLSVYVCFCVSACLSCTFSHSGVRHTAGRMGPQSSLQVLTLTFEHMLLYDFGCLHPYFTASWYPTSLTCNCNHIVINVQYSPIHYILHCLPHVGPHQIFCQFFLLVISEALLSAVIGYM